MNKLRILVLSPHTDDGELSAGGTIARLLEEGNEIFYTAFSICEKSVPAGYPPDVLQHECLAATKVLGIPKNNVALLRYEVRNFPEYRQQILENMLVLKKEIQPDIIFTPSSFDVHQDHRVIYMESLRAFKKSATILGMEHPWNNLGFKNDINVVLSQNCLDLKMKALERYVSQSKKAYFSKEYVTALARTHGLNVNSEYAESFECIQMII